MDQLRRVLATIQAYLGKLTVSQQLLIASVVVVMLMTLFVVQQYASKPDMVDLLPAGSSADDRAAAVTFLRTNNIEHAVGAGGSVQVPVDQRIMVISQMANQNALPSDGTVLFNNLISNSSWTLPTSQIHQLEIIAVQNELNRIITHFPGVRSANVILNMPSPRPLGKPEGKPSASATVFSAGGLNQSMVDSIAHLVSSSRGIAVENVRVIDGTTNRQWKPKSGEDLIATSNLELQSKIEERKRDQLYDMLSYIRGVIISVQAQVDTKRVAQSSRTIPKEGEGSWSSIAKSDTSEFEQFQPSTGGEAGARPNTGVDITTGNSSGSGSKESTTVEEFESFPGEKREETVDPRGYAKKIAAVVNIPESYFIDVWKRRQGPEAEGGPDAQPTDQELDPVRTAEINRIRAEVEKLIDSSANGPEGQPGEAEVSMIPVLAEALEPATQSAGFLAGGSGGAMAGWIKTVVLGLLALLSLGLIVMTAMRASKQERLPSANELVGIPPALQEDADLVGEAAEADSQLEGIELSEEEMKHHKQMEQVSGLVAEQPEQAAALLNKWIVAGR